MLHHCSWFIAKSFKVTSQLVSVSLGPSRGKYDETTLFKRTVKFFMARCYVTRWSNEHNFHPTPGIKAKYSVTHDPTIEICMSAFVTRWSPAYQSKRTFTKFRVAYSIILTNLI